MTNWKRLNFNGQCRVLQMKMRSFNGVIHHSWARRITPLMLQFRIFIDCLILHRPSFLKHVGHPQHAKHEQKILIWWTKQTERRSSKRQMNEWSFQDGQPLNIPRFAKGVASKSLSSWILSGNSTWILRLGSQTFDLASNFLVRCNWTKARIGRVVLPIFWKECGMNSVDQELMYNSSPSRINMASYLDISRKIE